MWSSPGMPERPISSGIVTESSRTSRSPHSSIPVAASTPPRAADMDSGRHRCPALDTRPGSRRMRSTATEKTINGIRRAAATILWIMVPLAVVRRVLSAFEQTPSGAARTTRCPTHSVGNARAPAVFGVDAAAPPNGACGAGGDVLRRQALIARGMPLRGDDGVALGQRTLGRNSPLATKRTVRLIPRAIADAGSPFVSRVCAALPPADARGSGHDLPSSRSPVSEGMPFGCHARETCREIVGP
jgi:hypothetical protein